MVGIYIFLCFFSNENKRRLALKLISDIKKIASFMKSLKYFLIIICTIGLSAIAKAQFTTEINPQLLTKKWDAKWIQHPNNNNQFGVYHFRKSFDLKSVPAKFVVHISADNRYWLFVNGKRICTGSAKGDLQHWQFESIHPFYDGNGRTGRIINVLYLILKGLLHEPVLYLSSYIIQNKGDYYWLLQEVRTKDNWEDWILYLLKGIEQTALSTIRQINKINLLFNETQKSVQEKLPRIYSKDLIEQLFVHPHCKIEFLVENLKLKRKTAGNYLKNLEEIGFL